MQTKANERVLSWLMVCRNWLREFCIKGINAINAHSLYIYIFICISAYGDENEEWGHHQQYFNQQTYKVSERTLPTITSTHTHARPQIKPTNNKVNEHEDWFVSLRTHFFRIETVNFGLVLMHRNRLAPSCFCQFYIKMATSICTLKVCAHQRHHSIGTNIHNVLISIEPYQMRNFF